MAADTALNQVGAPKDMPCKVRLLDASYDPAATFKACFAHCSAAFWLDSELSEQPRVRHSIMGDCSPQHALKFTCDVSTRVLTIQGPGGQTEVSGDLFQLMDDIFAALPYNSGPDLPFPFRAGIIGYLGYELKALIGSSNRHASTMPDAMFYLPQNMVVFAHDTGRIYHYHLWGNQTEWPSASIRPLKLHRPNFVPGAVAEETLSLADSAQAYMAKVQECLRQITNGESYEICLTNRAQLDLEDDPLSTYLRMRMISPVPYGAYLKDENTHILSASPETFLKIQANGSIESRPIKGTRARGATPELDAQLKCDLAASAKDRAENLMIVDLVRHDLNSICMPGSVNVPDAFTVETYSSVHQLVSTVQGQLQPGVGPFRAVRACFPGGSMTGSPKRRTMAIIDSLETSARGIYAGALGWIGLDGYTDLSIVIRTAVVRDGKANFGIGGAIVAGSDPWDEMQETLLKASVPFFSIKSGADAPYE
jgi:para-aminobenzoate synthetase